MYSLAYNSSIEASYVYRRGGYYYLFVSWGLCCHGVNSTYTTTPASAAAAKITGPYRDKTGRDMLDNGGSPFLLTNGPMIGPGQVAIFHYGDSDRVTMHYYDASQRTGKVSWRCGRSHGPPKRLAGSGRKHYATQIIWPK